jgi:hypothetical protein
MKAGKVVQILSCEQASTVLRRLVAKGGDVADAIAAEAVALLSEVNRDEVANEVYIMLDSIDVQDCWDRAGKHRHGYVHEDEVAYDLIQEVLRPFDDQISQYRLSELEPQEILYTQGVVCGLYRYLKESRSEFKDWCVDMPESFAQEIVESWRKRHTQDPEALKAMAGYLDEHCPEWSMF